MKGYEIILEDKGQDFTRLKTDDCLCLALYDYKKNAIQH